MRCVKSFASVQKDGESAKSDGRGADGDCKDDDVLKNQAVLQCVVLKTNNDECATTTGPV